MSGFVIGLVVLSLVNVAALAWQVTRLRAARISWRRLFAAAPTPMTGIAASYGVFAFNVLFVPWWVAVIEAAAFETVYIGLPALDNLTPAQHAKAKAVAMAAGWISFTQNLLSAFFYTPVGVKALDGITGSSLWIAAPFYLALAAAHASMVWIGYHAAILLFHRNAIDTVDGIVEPPAPRLMRVSPRPDFTRQRRLLAAPDTARAVKPVNVYRKQPGFDTKAWPAETVDRWIALLDTVNPATGKPYSLRAIAALDSAWPSHATIQKQIAARRETLAALQEDTA